VMPALSRTVLSCHTSGASALDSQSLASQDPATIEFSAKAHKLLVRIALIQGAVIFVAGLFLSTINLPFTRFRLQSSVILVIGAIAILASLLSIRRSAEMALALVTFLSVAIAVTGFGYRPVRRGDGSFGIGHSSRLWTGPDDWIEGAVAVDPKVGMVLPPHAVGRQHSPDFDVIYTSGPEGWRMMPDPQTAHPDSEIWFLGCSFTFGAGVQDDETYAYRLAAQAWPDTRVRNFAVSGYGTTNAYLNLKNQLSRRPNPSAVVYGWISHHRERNYLRRSWHRGTYLSTIPKFELVGGKLQFDGFVTNQEATIEDGPALDEIEFKITEALIREMARMTRERNIPLIMLLLQGWEDRVPMAVINEPGLYILDVRGVSNSYHPHDGHPTRVWHQAVARAIAGHPLLSGLTGNPKLFAPEAIPEAPIEGWTYWDGRKGGKAFLTHPQKEDQPLRLDLSSAFSVPSLIFGSPNQRWDVQLKYPVGMQRGHDYTLELEIRSNAREQVDYGVLENHVPYGTLGFQEPICMTAKWQTIRRLFTVDRDERDAQLVIAVGGTRWVELRKARLMDGSENLLTGRAKLLTPNDGQLQGQGTY